MASSFTARLKQIIRNNNLDYLFVEPSGMVLTHELRSVSVMGKRDVSYDIGGFITLIDGPSFESTWRERKDLLIGQIKNADLVMLSRSDLLKEAEMTGIRRVLSGHTENLSLLSTRQSIGVDQVFQRFH
jgi:G3E family GTPase